MDLNHFIREAQGTHIELVLLDAQGHHPAADGELSPEARYSAKKWLQARGLAMEEDLAGQYDLTYDGQRLAAALHKSRTHGEGRWELVTRAMVVSILSGMRPFAVTVVDGAEVTNQERELALTRLQKWHCIEVVDTLQSRFVRVDPLPELFEAASVVGPLKEHFEGRGYVDQRVSNTTHIAGGYVGGVQAGGTGNTMRVAQTISFLELTGITAKLDEILKMLQGVDGVDDLSRAVEDIRESAVLPEATKPSVKQKVFEAIGVAGNLSSVIQATPMLTSALLMLAQLLGNLG